MASIHRQHGKPHWFCAYYGSDGKRKFKSTKSTNRKQAETICRAWAKAAKKIRLGALSIEKAREIIEDGIAEMMEDSGHVLPHSSVAAFFKSWIDEKENVSSDRTYERYRGIVDRFVTFMGARAKNSLSTISVADLQAFRDEIANVVSPGTVNTYLKVIRSALERAVKQRYLTANPAALVDRVKHRRGDERMERRAFTLDELRKLLGAADQDWRLMTLMGLYTGLRLQDIANITWDALDLQTRELTLTTQKTGRRQVIPIHTCLLREITKREAGDDPKAALLPELAGKSSGWLSAQFYELMNSVHLVPGRNHHPKKDGAGVRMAEKGKGRGLRRTLSPISFHALRHTATSLLKNAGVSDVIARDIIGHESKAVSDRYTHIEDETKRAAIDKMPDVFAWTERLL